MSAPSQCCANCAWWSNTEPALATGVRRAEGTSPEIGICRLMPPTRIGIAGMATAMFPEIHYTRWCGSWTPDDDGDGPGGGERAPAGEVVPLRAAA